MRYVHGAVRLPDGANTGFGRVSPTERCARRRTPFLVGRVRAGRIRFWEKRNILLPYLKDLYYNKKESDFLHTESVIELS